MKNFTKQNFKTNPLWVRLLIITFMLLAGTSSAWAGYAQGYFYYDNSVTQYSSCYIYIGHNSWSDGTQEMSLVSGTRYLYSYNFSSKWDGATNWFICAQSKSGNSTSINNAWNTAKGYSKKPTDIYGIGNGNAYNIGKIVWADKLGSNYYSWSSDSKRHHIASSTTCKITLNIEGSGSVTVKNNAGTALISNAKTSTSKSSVQYLTYLKNITATAAAGYKLSSIKIGSTDYTSAYQSGSDTNNGYDLTGDVTITVTFEKSCEAPDEPTATVEQHTTKCNNTDRKQGIITLTNYNPDYTYKLGDDEVSVSDGKISGLAAGKYYITAVNSCTETKTTSTYDVTTTDVTPVATVKVTGDNEICSGETTTLTATVTATLGTVSSYSWSPNDGTKDGNKYTTPALTKNTSYLAQAKLINDDCEKTVSATAYTVTVNTAPAKPAVTLSPADGNIISGNKAILSVNSPVSGATYTLYEETKGEIETGTSFEITEAGTYYIKGANDCGDSPASDSKTITVCTIGSILNSAEYDPATQKVNLEGTFEVCGQESFHGFQWRKSTAGWCAENKGDGNSNYVALGTTTESATKTGEFSLSSLDDSYVFRTYVVPVGGAWIYGNEITVTPCITVATPNVTAEPICLGNEATLTLNNKQNGVTYELGNEEIFKIGNTHTVTPEKTTTYTITATSTNSCEAGQKVSANVTVEVNELPEAPVLAKTEETVCPNTQFKLPTIDGDWYAQEKGGSAYVSNTITNGVAATTYYYAEAVKYGCSSATRTRYTVNVHTAPVAPVITLNPATVGQDKNSELSISNETYSPSNTKYELYKGGEKVGEMLSQTTNVSSSNVGSVNYSVKATHKECADLTSTSNTVTLTVQEAGAIIAALGDLKVDPQDPVDFVAMYVKNDGLSDFTDQGATKVTGYTWEYSSDEGSNWTACASTNAVAGATYSIIGMENGSKNCNNFRPSAPGKYRCKVTYDKGEQTSNVLTVTGDGSTAKTFKGVTMNIPVISVNTGKEKFPTCDGLSGTASKNADVIKEKISVDVKIFAKVGDNIEVVYDRKARMNYRGSSSLNFVKKSYAFCTGKEKTKNDKGAVDTGKENLFGLSNGVKDKDWVLYAAAADPSIMRNRLMLDTFRDMTGGWSVGSKYVELVVNGEYKGVYVLMDKITANMGDEEVEKDGRVEVEWKLDKQGNTTQEGFIVKFDKTDIVDRYENTSGDQKTFKSTYSGHDGFTTYDTQIDQRFEIEYPEKEDIEEEDLEKGQRAGDWSVVFNSIKDKFNKFEKELKEGNFTEVQKLIDYTSWADWFIITEFGKNIDGYRASNLFVYDGSKANAKIEARPLWDQELSFDNHCPNYYAKYGANSESGLMIDKSNDEAYNNDASTPFWFTGRYTGGRGTYNGSNQTFKGLLDDPCFVAMVKTRWAKHKADALSEDKLNDKVTAYTTEMGAAKDREATFWSTRSRETCQCSYSGSTGYVYVSFTDSKNAITNWIKKRPAGLTKAIDALKGLDLTISLTVTPDGGEITPWEAVMVQVNNPSGYDYDLNYTTNTLDKVEGVIISENNDKYTYRIPRPSTWGTGDGERDAIEYGIQAILNVADDNLQCGTINEELTKADVTITLKDEEDDNCSIVEP